MSEEYVSRDEFNQLKSEMKQEVNEIKKETAENSKILQAIDKKIDVIDAKMVTAKEIDDLKLTPLEKRVNILEDSQRWLRRTVIGGIITVVIGAIVFVVKIMP